MIFTFTILLTTTLAIDIFGIIYNFFDSEFPYDATLYSVSIKSNNDTTTSSEISASISSSSSKTISQYKEGRVYTIKRSNKGIISDEQLQEVLDKYVVDIDNSTEILNNLMDGDVELTIYI